MKLKHIQYCLDIAEVTSRLSKDRSTKVGAVISTPDGRILSTGYNGFPRGVNDDRNERHSRPAKYLWTEHAERNAIYNAAYQGIKLEGTALFINWRPPVCADCARAVIQSGIRSVYGTEQYFPGHKDGNWRTHLGVAFEMFAEAGVTLWKVYPNGIIKDMNSEIAEAKVVSL